MLMSSVTIAIEISVIVVVTVAVAAAVVVVAMTMLWWQPMVAMLVLLVVMEVVLAVVSDGSKNIMLWGQYLYYKLIFYIEFHITRTIYNYTCVLH